MPVFHSRLLLATLATVLTARAQTIPPDDDPVELENVIVSAHPYARSQTDLAQPTSVLQGRQLALHQSNSLGELLAGEPGVSSTYFGPGASRPVIRGLGGDRIRVLDNGTGTIDASVTSPDHAVSIDPLLVERVEVVRGPASLLYGGAAVGGVVNVITHRIHHDVPDALINGRAELRAGSVNDETSGGVVLEGGAGNHFAWHLDGFRRETADIDIPGYAESARRRALEAAEEAEEHEDHEDHDDETDHNHEEESAEAFGTVPNTALTTDGGAFGFSFIGEAGYLGVSFSGLNSLYGVPPGAHEHEHEHEHEDGESPDEDHDEHDEDHEESEAEFVRIDLKQRRLDLEGEWRINQGVWRAARFKFGRADYRHQELEGDEIGTVFTNEGYEGRAELLHDAIGPFSGAIGLQASRSELSAIGEEAFMPPARTEQQAVFLFEEATVGALVWQGGARLERQDIELTDGSDTRRDDDNVSVSTGVVWTLDDAWSLSGSVTRTERSPNAQELFSNGPHVGSNAFEIGDASLDKETSVGLDVTLRRRLGFVTASLTGFVNDFDGFIFENPTGEEEDGLSVYRYEQHAARFHGAELETIWHLHDSTRHSLDLTIAGDFVRGRDTDNSRNLPRVTPPRARVGLDGRVGAFAAGVELQAVSSQNHVATDELPTDRYTLVSAYVGYRFVTGGFTWDAFVRGSNLTDEEARVHNSFLKDVAPLPGRNVTAGVRLGF